MTNNQGHSSSEDSRLEELGKVLIEIASGNFNARISSSSDDRDDLDAVITGINMLAEELKSSTVSRDYLQSVQRGIVDMMIILNPDSTIQSINQTVVDLLSYSENELISQPFKILFEDKSLEQVKKITVEDGHFSDIEIIFLAKDGRRIPASCSASILKGKEGEELGVLYIAKDVSRLKKIEEELKIKNNDLNTFIYKASHDLKGPLVSVMGLTGMVGYEIKDPVALHYFDMIHKTTSNLNNILKNLIEIASVEKAKKERQKIDFNDKVTKVLESLILTSEYTKVKVNNSIEVEKEFYGNARMIFSVLQNILENSFKYRNTTNSNSYIYISIRDFYKGVQITIEDNGIGIRHDFQPKIYDMFFRGTNQAEGSGLGLYLARNYVYKMGGEINLKSEEGKGTTFTIYLPTME